MLGRIDQFVRQNLAKPSSHNPRLTRPQFRSRRRRSHERLLYEIGRVKPRDRDKIVGQMREALDEAEAAARRREEERSKQFAAMEETVRARERTIDEYQQENRERYRWKWWLMLPLIRMGLMKLPRVRK